MSFSTLFIKHCGREVLKKKQLDIKRLYPSSFVYSVCKQHIPYSWSHECKSETLEDANDGTSTYIKATCLCVSSGVKCAGYLLVSSCFHLAKRLMNKKKKPVKKDVQKALKCWSIFHMQLIDQSEPLPSFVLHHCSVTKRCQKYIWIYGTVHCSSLMVVDF